jgi:hypothetical protein
MHYKPIFDRLLAEGDDAWDDSLWSFAHGPRSKVIPLYQLLVTIDAGIQHMGGFRLATRETRRSLGVPIQAHCLVPRVMPS